MGALRTALRRIVRDIRAAIAGTEEDYTRGDLSRAITLLAIPMVLEMAMESIFGIVDVFCVARLGSESVAAVGLTESMLTIVFAIAIGLSMGTTAMVARRIGEGNDAEAASVTAQAIIIAVAISTLLGLVGIIWAPKLLELMGASDTVIATGRSYTAIILGSSLVIFLLFLVNAAFRGAGDAAIAMRVLWIANLVNIVLDPCLIFGLGPFPALGVMGAAIATTIGRGTGVVLQLVLLFRGRGRLRLSLGHFRLRPRIMSRLIRVSIGGILQFLVATASWIALVRIIAVFGEKALAGYTVALRIIVFAILPSWGMSNAAATLVGQNLGAGRPDRAERSVWIAGIYNMIFLGAVTVVFLLFADSLIALFTTDPVALPVGVSCLRIVSYGYVFYAWGMVMEQAFNGAGDTFTPTLINLCCYWLFQIPLAYFLAQRAGWHEEGVFWAITAAESLLAIAAVVVFRRGRWKTTTV